MEDKHIVVSYRNFCLLIQGFFFFFMPSCDWLCTAHSGQTQSRAQGNQRQIPGAEGSQVSAMAEACCFLVAVACRTSRNIYFTSYTTRLLQILWRMDQLLRGYKGKTELKPLKGEGREHRTSHKAVVIRNPGERRNFTSNGVEELGRMQGNIQSVQN